MGLLNEEVETELAICARDLRFTRDAAPATGGGSRLRHEQVTVQ